MKINGEKFKYYRIEKHYTQETLAQGICSITYLSKLENNKIDCSEDILHLLCDKLDISPERLTFHIPSHFHSLFHQSYKNIKHQNENHSLQTFAEIEKYSNHHDPTILTYYQLIALRYALFLDQQEEADLHLNKLNQLKNYLNEEESYYYYLFRGIYEYYYHSFPTALEHLKKAETISNRLHIYEAELSFYMALTYSNIKKVALALSYCTKAEELYSKEMNYKRVIDCHLLMGINYNHIKAFDLAESSFEKILSSLDILNKPNIKESIYHNLAITYSGTGEHEKAIDYFRKSLKHKTITSEVKTVYLLTKEFMTISDVDHSTKWFNYGKHLAYQHDIQEYKLKFNVLEYHLSNTFNQLYEAYLSHTVIPHFQERGNDDAIYYIEELANYYLENFHYKDASKYLSMANKILREGKR